MLWKEFKQVFEYKNKKSNLESLLLLQQICSSTQLVLQKLLSVENLFLKETFHLSSYNLQSISYLTLPSLCGFGAPFFFLTRLRFEIKLNREKLNEIENL